MAFKYPIMMHGIPKVDEFIETKCADFAVPIVKELRRIYLEAGLKEEFKWSNPCYSHHGLICSIGSFKKHVASWFFKGSLLEDPDRVLRKAQKDTKGLRSLYLEAGDTIDERQVQVFVQQAMILNEKGIDVKYEKKPPPPLPDYMRDRLKKHGKAFATFEQMAPSHRKEYILWVTDAKHEETRERRIEKMLALLEEGKGLNDKYRK